MKKVDNNSSFVDGIKLNNAEEFLLQLRKDKLEDGLFTTIVQGNKFSGVNVSAKNLDANTDLIINCWH